MHPVVRGSDVVERVEDAEGAVDERKAASSHGEREVFSQCLHSPESRGLLSELVKRESKASHRYVSVGLECIVT